MQISSSHPRPPLLSYLPTMSYLQHVLYNQRLQMLQLAMLNRRFVYPVATHVSTHSPSNVDAPTAVALKRKASSQDDTLTSAKRAPQPIDQKIQNMQLQQALYAVESQKYIKVLTSIKLHESEGVIKTFKEIQYPYLIDEKPVKLVLILFQWEKEWVWTVNNTNFTAPFCSMNQGNTNRKAQDLKEYEDKVIVQSQIVYSTHVRKQKSLVLTSLGVHKMCDRYQHIQPQYVAWIRAFVLPLLLIHAE